MSVEKIICYNAYHRNVFNDQVAGVLRQLGCDQVIGGATRISIEEDAQDEAAAYVDRIIAAFNLKDLALNAAGDGYVDLATTAEANPRGNFYLDFGTAYWSAGAVANKPDLYEWQVICPFTRQQGVT